MFEMHAHGYCMKCGRVKRVNVKHWTKPLPVGICRDCQDKKGG
jgi:hypothetical protein